MIEGDFASGLRSVFHRGSLALHDAPLFSELTEEYKRAIQLAIEERVFRTDRQAFARARELARRAGEKDALPQDLVAVHLAALAKLSENVSPKMAKACVMQARLLLIKMIGELALYYREKALPDRKAAG